MNRRGDFVFESLTDLSALKDISAEWTNLWSRCPAATSFQRPEWLTSWVQAFRPQGILVVAARRRQELVGLAPMFHYKWGDERVLAPIGASISDYLDWLLEPDHSAEILEGIFECFENGDRHWTRLDLTDIPPDSALLTKRKFGDCEIEHSSDNACPVLQLPSSFEKLEESLPSKFRHNLRTARRRSERAGEISIEVADEDKLPEFLAAMLDLHRARWTELGMPGMLAETRVQEFHQLAAPALLEQKVLRLYGMRLKGNLIATLYALSEQHVVYCYLQAFDPAYAHLSPGVQILAAVLEDAIRYGKREVDFLRGREPYKYLWGARDRQTYRIAMRRPVRVFSPNIAA